MISHRLKWVYKLILVFFLLSLFQGWFLLQPPELDSATLTNAKDLLENSRLSYSTALEGAHSIGDTTITIDTSNYPDQNNFHIFPGDSAVIGSHSYTVGTVIDDATDDKFTITTALQSGDTADDTKIYVKQTAIHTVYFTTTSAVADGAIRISVPATANDTNDSDTYPDADGFDLNAVVDGDITCPGDDGNYDFVTGTATDAGGGGWHTFECRYSGTGAGSTAMSMTIGGTHELLNPAPDATHVQGTADDYTIRIQNLNASDSAIDAVDAKVIVVEAIRVSATVEETLTFTIALVSASANNCGTGASTDVATTVYSVPFGAVTSPNTFYDAEHQLTVSTNADDGYEITVFEDDELGFDGAASPYIPDTPCDVACTHTTAQEWVTTSTNGFGYSLQNATNNDAKFEWDDNTPTTGFKAKQFPNRTEGLTQDQDTDAEIMSNAGPVSGSSIYVCYRVDVSGSQEAGNYYNTITYIATPQF